MLDLEQAVAATPPNQQWVTETLAEHRKRVPPPSDKHDPPRWQVFKREDFSAIDLGEEPLRAVTFEECRFVGYEFGTRPLQHVKFIRCIIENCTFGGTTLTKVGVEECACTDVEFTGVQISNVAIANSKLLRFSVNGRIDNGRLEVANCRHGGSGELRFHSLVGEGMAVGNCDFGDSWIQIEDVQLRRLDLSALSAGSIRCRRARLQALRLEGVRPGWLDLVDVLSPRTLIKATEVYAGEVRRCDFPNAEVERSVLENVRLDDVDFTRATVRGLDLYRSTLRSVRGLHGRDRAKELNVSGAEGVTFAEEWHWFSWTRLRGAGTVPVFGVSNVALIAILALAAGADWYNAQLAALQTSGSVVAQTPWVQRLSPMSLPWSFGVTLGAIVLLAAASTIYRFACPEEIQEFSATQWRDEHGKPLIQYLSLGYIRPWWRVISGTLYVLGGGWTVLYLGWRLGHSLGSIFGVW